MGCTRVLYAVTAVLVVTSASVAPDVERQVDALMDYAREHKEELVAAVQEFVQKSAEGMLSKISIPIDALTLELERPKSRALGVNFLEQIIMQTVKDGYLGYGPLDPIIVEDFNFSFGLCNNMFMVNADVENATVAGLGDLEPNVTYSAGSLLRPANLELDLFVPVVDVTASHEELLEILSSYQMQTHGSLSMQVHNVRLRGDLSISQLGTLTACAFDLHATDVQVAIEVEEVSEIPSLLSSKIAGLVNEELLSIVIESINPIVSEKICVALYTKVSRTLWIMLLTAITSIPLPEQ